MCKSDSALEKSEAGAPETEIEITPEMIAAGMDYMYDHALNTLTNSC